MIKKTTAFCYFTLLTLIFSLFLLTACSQKKENGAKSSTDYITCEIQTERVTGSTTAVSADAGQTDNVTEQTASQVESSISNEQSGSVEPDPGEKSDENTKKESVSADGSQKETELDAEKTELEDKIVKKYYAEAAALRGVTAAKLQALIKQALKELEEDKASEDHSALYDKYLNLTLALQEECDSKFNDIIDRMTGELKENGLPPDAVDEARQQYEAEKQEQISSLSLE